MWNLRWVVLMASSALALRNCVSNSPISSDIWCNATCAHSTPSCPSSLCVCDAEPTNATTANTTANTTDNTTDALPYPGTCTALPGSTATDSWCQATCAREEAQDCSYEMCTCTGWASSLTGGQIQSCVALNNLATENWCLASCRFGVCPESLCQCFTTSAQRLEYDMRLALSNDLYPYNEDFGCCLAQEDQVWFIGGGDLYNWTLNGKNGRLHTFDNVPVEPYMVVDFDNAVDIEIEINGGIWVSDWGAAKIYRYNATTDHLQEVVSWHYHQVDAAKSITICHEKIYAATTNALVAISVYPDYTFKSKETFMFHTGNLVDITCLPDGDILAVMNDRIQRIHHDTKEISSFITNSLLQRLPDIQDLDYLEPCGLVFTVPDANQIWRCPNVSDSSTCGIHCPDAGTDADSCAYIQNPWGISMDCDCNIFVTSKGNGNVVWYEGSFRGAPNQREWNPIYSARENVIQTTSTANSNVFDPTTTTTTTQTQTTTTTTIVTSVTITVVTTPHKLRNGVLRGNFTLPQAIKVYAPITDGSLAPDGSNPCFPTGTCGGSPLGDHAGCAASSTSFLLAKLDGGDNLCSDPDDCTLEECCQEPGICAYNYSTVAECEVGGYDLVDPSVNPTAYCANYTCTAAECCAPKGICSHDGFTSDAACAAADPGGRTLLSISIPAKCSGVQCTPEDCCVEPGKCGDSYIDTPNSLASVQCMLDAAVAGNDLLFIKTGVTETTRCVGIDCTQEECCMAPSNCSADQLNTNARCNALNPAYPLARPDANSTVCAFPQCGSSDCCMFSSPSPTPSPEKAIFFSTSFQRKSAAVAQSGTGQTPDCDATSSPYDCYEWALVQRPIIPVKVVLNVEHRNEHRRQSGSLIVQDETGESFYTCLLINSKYTGADGQDAAFLRACLTRDGRPVEPVFVKEIQELGKSYYKCPCGGSGADSDGKCVDLGANTPEYEYGTPIEVENLPGSTSKRDTLGYTGHDTQKCSIVPQRKHIVTSDENGINYLENEAYRPRVYFRNWTNATGTLHTAVSQHASIRYGWTDATGSKDYSWEYKDHNGDNSEPSNLPNWDSSGRQNSGWVAVLNCEDLPAETEMYLAYPLPHIKYTDPLFGPRNHWLVNGAGILPTTNERVGLDQYPIIPGLSHAWEGLSPWILYNSTREALGFYENTTTNQQFTPHPPGSPLRIEPEIMHGVDSAGLLTIQNQWVADDGNYEWIDSNGDVLEDTDPRTKISCADVCQSVGGAITCSSKN